MLGYQSTIGHDGVKSLMEQVVKQCINDYSLGIMSKSEIEDWLDDTPSICFITDCLRDERGSRLDDVSINDSTDLCSYVEREIEKIDKKNASIETLQI